MPRQDRTGPEGNGPATGRGMGGCKPTKNGSQPFSYNGPYGRQNGYEVLRGKRLKSLKLGISRQGANETDFVTKTVALAVAEAVVEDLAEDLVGINHSNKENHNV